MAELKAQKVVLAKDLFALTGLKRTQIAAKVADGTFPAPVRLSERRKAWFESEIASWQIEQIRKRDGKETK